MIKKIGLFTAFFLFSIVSVFSDQRTTFLFTSNGFEKDETHYFRDNITLTAKYRSTVVPPQYTITLGSKSSNEKNYEEGKIVSGSMTLKVSSTGTHHARLERNWRDGVITYRRSIYVEQDRSPPNVKITVSPAGWTSGYVTLTASVSDIKSGVKSLEYSLDQRDWHSGNSITVTNNSVVYFRSYDNVGNGVIYPYTVSTIDKTRPSLSVSASTTGWTSGNVTLTASAGDGQSGLSRYEYSVDNVHWYSGNRYTASSNTTVYFRVFDRVGNYSKKSITVNNIDKTPPSVSVSASRSDWTRSFVVLTPRSNENQSGIKYYQYSLDEVNWHTANTYTASESRIVYFRAIDNVGNVSSSVSYNVKNIDKSIPKLNITSSPSEWTNQDVTVKSGAVDSSVYPVSDIRFTQYSFDKSTWIVGSEYVFKENGTIYFKTRDNAGNTNTHFSNPQPFTVTNIDKTKPILSLTNGHQDWYSGPVLIEASVAGGSPINQKSWNVPDDSPLKWRVIEPNQIEFSGFQQGENAINIVGLKDMAGNDAVLNGFDSYKIQFDTEKPEVRLNRKEPFDKNIYEVVTVKDDVSKLNLDTVQHVLNPPENLDTITEDLWKKGLPSFPPGSHTRLAYRVSDNAGNVTVKSEVVDRKKPVISVVSDYSSWFNESVKLKLSVSDDSPIVQGSWKFRSGTDGSWISVDSTTETGAEVLLKNLKPGENTIFVRVADSHENISDEFSVVIRYDSEAPEFKGLFTENNSTGELVGTPEAHNFSSWQTWTNEDVTVKAVAEDPVSQVSVLYKVLANDNSSGFTPITLPGEFQDYTAVAPSFSTLYNTESSYTVYIKILDEAGNVTGGTTDDQGNICSGKVVLHMDKIPPEFTQNLTFKKSTVKDNLIVNSYPVLQDSSLGEVSYTPAPLELEYSFDTAGPWTVFNEVNSEVVIPYTQNDEGEKKLYLRFTDRAGNNTVSSGIDFIIDRTGPVLDFKGAMNNPYVDINSHNIVLTEDPLWTDIYSDISNASLSYSLSTSETLINPENLTWSSYKREIPVPLEMRTEGLYYIHYSAEDVHGNKTYSTQGLEFIADNTPPTVTAMAPFEKYQGEFLAIKEGGYSRDLEVYISPQAVDTYLTDRIGDISHFILKKSAERDGPFSEILPQNINSENRYSIELLPGINYVKIFAVDKAGNVSESNDLILPVVVDNGVPYNISVTSPTYPRAYSEADTVSFSDGRFSLEAMAGASGVSHYNYKLFKDYPENYEAGISVFLDSGRTGLQGRDPGLLELSFLKDNLGDTINSLFEYYYLEVKAVSGNGKESDSVSYRFRVDTAPPTALTINSTTHPQSSLYYNEKNAYLTWEEPQDLTGIKNYYYQFVDNRQVTSEQIKLLEKEVLAKDFTLSGEWSLLKKRELNLDLDDFLKAGDNAPGYGEVTLLLCAEDWAGQKQFDSHTMRFDMIKPEIAPKDSLDDKIFFTVDPVFYGENMDLTVSWNPPEDRGGSGYRSQKLFLQSVKNNTFQQVFPAGSEGQKINPGREATSFTIYGLPREETTYRLVLEIYDNAGNQKTYNQFFNQTGVIDTAPEFSIPFDNTFYGYRVAGQTLIDAWAELYLPASLGLKQSGSLIPKLPLTLKDPSMSEFSEGFYQGDLDFILGGFSLGASGLSLNSSGLSLQEGTLSLPGTVFPRKNASAEENTLLSVNASLLITSPSALSVKLPVQASDPAVQKFNSRSLTGENTSWELFSESSLDFYLEGTGFYISEALLPREPHGRRGFSVYSDSGNVALKNIRISPEWQVLEADFATDQPFIIENDKYKMRVHNGVVRGKKILIEEGEILMDSSLNLQTKGQNAHSVHVKDIIMNFDGTLNKGSQFRVMPFSYSYDGTEYSGGSEIFFTADGLSVSGSLTVNGSLLNYSGHILTKAGIDVSLPGEIQTLVTIPDFGGYWVQAERVELKGSDLIIRKAVIRLPSELGGQVNLMAMDNRVPLIFRSSDFQLMQEGVWSFIQPLASEHGFSEGLEFQSLKLGLHEGVSHVSFPEVKISLSAPFTAEDMILTNLHLNRNKTLGSSDAVSFHNITLGEFTYEARDLVFDTDRISVGSFILQSPGDDHLHNLDFKGLVFNGSGILSLGAADIEKSFSPAGWDVTLSEIKQIPEGLSSHAVITLPENLGGKTLSFKDFRLFKNGLYESGISKEVQFLSIGGWRILARNLSLDNESLTLGESEVRLFSSLGGKILNFKDIELGVEGEVLASPVTTSTVKYLSENGFNLEVSSYKISQSGILQSGKVLLPKAIQTLDGNIGVSFSGHEILLKSSGMVVTPRFPGSLSYSVGGMDLKASGIRFSEEGLTIEENTLSVKDYFDVQLGSIKFYSSGDIRFGGEVLKSFTFAPFGPDSFSFAVNSLVLSDEGVNIKSFVTLPKGFAAETIFFDELTIHPDGSITSDIAVPKLKFSKMGTNFEFTDIHLDGDGFSISEAVITLPESMENKQITLSNFRINKEGEFELDSTKIDPFEMWGYTFYLDHLGFGVIAGSGEKGISFTGGVRLPADFPVPELASKRFSIYELEAPYSGKNIQFKLSLDDTIHMKLFNKWGMSITGISVDQDFKLVINQGSVDLPSEFSKSGGADAQLKIKDITINPKNGSLEVNEVTASDLSYYYQGLKFAIEKVSLSQDKGLEIVEGSVKIPANDPDKPKYPKGLDNTTLTIHKLQITNDFEVGELRVSAVKEFKTPVFDGMFYLEPVYPEGYEQGDPAPVWKLALEKEGDDLFLAASATVRLGESFPPGIRGRALVVGSASDSYGIKVNIATGSIKTFDVKGDFVDPETGKGMTYALFGNSMETDALHFNYREEEDDFELKVIGTTLTLDSPSTPEFLKNTVCEVSEFKINDSGRIKVFDSTITYNQKKEFYPGIYLENWKLGITAVEEEDLFQFSVLPNGENGNQIELGSSFPEGIAGTKSNISRFSVDSKGNIGDLDFSVTLSPSLELFGNLTIRGLNTQGQINDISGAKIQFIRSQSQKDFIVKLIAGARLSDSLPQGFAGLEIPVRDFTFDTSGRIINLDMGLTGLNLPIFGGMTLNHGAIGVSYEPVKTEEFIFNFSGDITLPSVIKNKLGGLETLNIIELSVSSSKGLVAFDAGVQGSVKADLFAGMDFSFEKLNIGTEGFNLTGDLSLPETLAKGLPESIRLETFSMNWKGEIIDIAAGISRASVTVGGFNTLIENFVIHKDKITMDTFRITLPSEMGGMGVGFRDAGFDFNGKFFGECIMDKIESPDIAGFKIVLYEPGLDIDRKQLSFKRVFCKTPDFVGAVEVGIDGVKISPSGISISGGEFALPDFAIGDGLGFKDVRVKFLIDGSRYYVKGGGKLLVPGMGTFGAEVSFTNPSRTYPIGLERAYFEWTAYGPGIAMGNTGMFLNGIRGGVTFGPPIELPPSLKPMFDDGIRIQLGLTVVDGSGGALVKGDADIWLDITDWDMAFRGNLAVLNGMANAEVLAAITGRGFYGSLEITLLCLNGRVEVYIWDHYGETLVSGDARVRVGFKRGFFVNKKILGVRIRIPTSDIWLGPIGAQFGRFHTGSGGSVNGVKGYVDVPVWGEVSAFISYSGSLKVNGVNSYRLYKPGDTRTRSVFTVEEEKNKVRVMDTRGLAPVADEWRFRVGGEPTASSTRSLSREEDPRGTDRLIFIVVYPEGDPHVTAISPSGEEFTTDSPSVLVERTEWGMQFVVLNPEDGEWGLSVDNMPTPDSYEIMVYGNQKAFRLEQEDFPYDRMYITSPYTHTGQVIPPVAGKKVDIYAAEERGTYIGYKIEEVVTDAEGRFTAVIDPELLIDGEVSLYTTVAGGEDPDIQAFIGGSLLINNNDPLPPVENLLLSSNDEKDLVVNFDKLYQFRVKAYNLTIVNTETGESETYNLGLQNSFVIPGLDKQKTYRAWITAVDHNGIEGVKSREKSILLDSQPQIVNDFTISENLISLETEAGSEVSTVIHINAEGSRKTDSASDYIQAEISRDTAGNTDWEKMKVIPRFDTERVNISRGTGEVKLTLSSDESILPGEYRYTVKLVNMGNRELKKTLPVVLSVKPPVLDIIDIAPDVWEQGQSGDFEIYGNGFTDGIRLLVNNEEIPTKEKGFARITAAIPEVLAQGENQITLITSDGQEKSFTVDVIGPDWNLISYKGYSEVNPGSSTSLFFSIVGLDGFSGSVPFETRDLPAGWTEEWQGQFATEGVISRLNLYIPETTLPGSYRFTIEDIKGKVIPGEIIVTTSDIKPVISSLSSLSLLPGEELALMGYGFTESHEVYIGNKPQQILSRDSDKILIQTGANLVSGPVTVRDGQSVSNSINLHARERGYSIYPQKEVLNLQPGESLSLPVVVSGYSDSVNLNLINNNSDITASLRESSLKLNGETKLNITVSSSVSNGTYPIVIQGHDGYSSVDKVIRIQIGEAFAFTSQDIPSFSEGVTSSFFIETENGEGEVYYHLKEGYSLPAGLEFSKKGEIRGKAGYGQKDKTIRIEAEDEAGRIISQSFIIRIEENSWPQAGKNGGNTRYNPVPSPAEARIRWSSELNSKGSRLVAAQNRVFVLTEEGITVLAAHSGLLLYTVRGEFSQFFYSSDSLFTLDSDRNLQAWGIDLGREKWQREGVLNFTTDGFTLVIEDEEGMKDISLTDGQLRAGNSGNLNGHLLWFRNRLIKASEGRLFLWKDSQWKVVIEEVHDSITGMTADDENLIVLWQSGEILSLDKDLAIHKRAPLLFPEGQTALTEKHILVHEGANLLILNRDTLEEEDLVTTAEGTLVVALEKIFIAGERGLESRNIYNGELIWEKEGIQKDLVLVGEELLVLDNRGVVTCYNGRDNIEAPVTQLELTPEIPNGEKGYYTVTPSVSVNARDKETYVASRYFQYGEQEFDLWDTPVDLPDGEYSLSAYSIDSKGLRGLTDVKYIKIDTVVPQTLLHKEHTTGERGFTTSHVLLTLSASDETSGVKETRYILNGSEEVYSEPLSITEEGEYTFTWYSLDFAGNREAEQSFDFVIDLNNPKVRSEIYEDKEYGVVYLFGEDSLSGVNRIEYRINGSDTRIYQDPVYLPAGETWNLTYRAADNAGRSSQWTDIVLDLSQREPVDLITDFKTTWGNGKRYVKKDIQPGDPLYLKHNGGNRIEYIPQWLAGGEMIIGAYNDKYSWERNFYSFTAGEDIDLFIVKNKFSGIRLDNTWTLAAADVPVAYSYFTGGADIWHKTCKKGEKIVLGGSAMWQKGGPNLIIAGKQQAADLRIFSPNPSKELNSLDTAWFAATGIRGERKRNWSYRIDGGQWNSLGNSFSGELDIPYMHQGGDLELKVDVTASSRIYTGKEVVLTDVRKYKVVNHSGIEIIEPVSGSQILKNLGTKIHHITRDVKGNVSGEKVQWKTYNGIMAGSYYLPEKAGNATVIGTLPVYEEWNKETTLKLRVVDEWEPEIFLFNNDMTGEYSLREDGRYYGFSKNYDHRMGETTWVDVPLGKYWSNNRVTQKYLALEKTDSFNYKVNNGFYKIKLLLGPLNKRDFPFVQIEESVTEIEAGYKRQVYRVEITAEVRDNTLTLRGSQNLQILQMEVQRTERPGGVTVTPINNWKIMTDQKWYLWNPGHYYPKRQWDFDKKEFSEIKVKNNRGRKGEDHE